MARKFALVFLFMIAVIKNCFTGLSVKFLEVAMKMVKSTIVGLSLAFAMGSHATQIQQNLNATVSVSNACSIVSVSDATWSAIDGNFQSNANSSSGGVTVLCTDNTPYSIGLNNGQNFSTSRRMTDGSGDYISYNVYQDSGYSVAWGDIGSGSELTGTGNGANQASTVYAQIPSGQSPVPAGSYSDVIVVTLNF